MTKTADPQPQGNPSDPAPPAPTPEISADAARDLLIRSGYQVLTKEQLEERIRRAERPVAAVRTELETARAEAAQAQARLRELENVGKSQSDLAAEQRAEALRRLDEAQKAALAADARASQAEKSKLEMLLDLRLGSMLSGAVDPDAALLLAKARVKGLSIAPDGTLIHTDAAGIERKGADAEAVVRAWWGDAKFLHSAPAPGPATGGSTPAPPSEKPKIRAVERWDRYAEAERLDAQARAQRGR